MAVVQLGPLTPGIADPFEQVGPADWANPDNIKIVDAVGAVATLNGQGVDLLFAYGFGFDVPAAATGINGINVVVNSRYLGPVSPAPSVQLFLTRNLGGGGPTASGLSFSFTPPAGNFNAQGFGGPGQDWGSYTIAQVEDASGWFGCRLQVVGGAVGQQVEIDAVRITVWVDSPVAVILPTSIGSSATVPPPKVVHQVALGAPAASTASVPSPNVARVIRPAPLTRTPQVFTPHVIGALVQLGGPREPAIDWDDNFETGNFAGWTDGAETAGGGTVTIINTGEPGTGTGGTARRARVTWAEIDVGVPPVADPRRARVTWAEMQVA